MHVVAASNCHLVPLTSSRKNLALLAGAIRLIDYSGQDAYFFGATLYMEMFIRHEIYNARKTDIKTEIYTESRHN